MPLRKPTIVLLTLLLTVPTCFGAGLESLQPGVANLESAGVLAFGPEGVLFVGDSQAGAIWALDTADGEAGSGSCERIRNRSDTDALAGQLLRPGTGLRFHAQ